MVANVKWEFELVKVDYSNELILNIKFKLKGKFFRIKMSKVVASSKWIDKIAINHKAYSNYDEYEKDMYSYLEDTEKAKKEVKYMILEYFRIHSIKDKEQKRIKKLKELVKNSKDEMNLNII